MYVLILIHKTESKMLKVVGSHIDTNGNKVILHGPTVVVEKVGPESHSGLHFTILVIDTSYESVKYKLSGAKIA